MKKRFKEIDVERINIVEEDGTLRMTISNRESAPDWDFDGEVHARPKHAGMIFYNDDGVECGGLVFTGSNNNGKPEAGMSLTMDQINTDQVIGIQYSDGEDGRSYGIRIWDRPEAENLDHFKWVARIRAMEEGPEKDEAMKKVSKAFNRGDFGRDRMFMGKNSAGEAIVSMNDSKGRPRIRMKIDVSDMPRLEFLNEDGDVVYSFPPRMSKVGGHRLAAAREGTGTRCGRHCGGNSEKRAGGIP